MNSQPTLANHASLPPRDLEGLSLSTYFLFSPWPEVPSLRPEKEFCSQHPLHQNPLLPVPQALLAQKPRAPDQPKNC